MAKKTRNTATHYRQGDVLVRRVESIPAGAKAEPEASRIVLAHGEVTGHAHAIAQTEARAFTFTEAGGVVRRFLEALGLGAKVKHEEHATVQLPPGFYEIVRQREYSPEEIRNVAD